MTTLTTQLIARRVIVGALTPEGRRISMLVEQMRNPTVLPAAIANTVREIEQIQRDGGLYVHEHHIRSKGAM
jgi:hypothetical protein